MRNETLYTPISEARQAGYEEWLIATYGAQMADDIAHARAHLDKAPEGMGAKMAELRDIEAALVAAFEEDRADLDALFDRHRGWVAAMWGRECGMDAYAGLADLYQSHPDFVARYEQLAPRFSGWLCDGMRAYALGKG